MKQADPFIEILQTWAGIFWRQSLHQLLQYLQESGLSIQQIRALFRIQDCPRGVSELGIHLGVSKAAASQMLDRMVEQGFIVRSEDPLDRRSKYITLTEKGRQAMQKSLEARRVWLNQLASKLTPQEKEDISRSLSILVAKAREMESELSQ